MPATKSQSNGSAVDDKATGLGEGFHLSEVDEKASALASSFPLPSGAIATKKQLKGRDFFKFQEMAAKSATDAMRWVVMQAFEVDGQPLSIDQLEDEFSFEDVAMLSAEINKSFLPYLPAKK